MNYIALLYDDPNSSPPERTPEWEALLEEYFEFDRFAGEASIGGAALQGPSEAFTVRGGESPVVTDGPFAEATEVIGGFYVLDAPNLDDAIKLASRIPAASTGAVEVRPMVEWTQLPLDTRPVDADGNLLPRYVALLLYRETDASIPGTDEWQAGAERHQRFAEQVGELVRAGGALHPAATATTLRVRDGEQVLSDGPFLETAEVVGGLYIISAANREEAAKTAALIPIDDGAVELYPVMDFET